MVCSWNIGQAKERLEYLIAVIRISKNTKVVEKNKTRRSARDDESGMMMCIYLVESYDLL
jgi:hypothetical protein